MGDTSPNLQRAVMVLLAAVIAITFATGIVGAVNVGSKSTGTVAAGAAQPSAGAQAQAGPQGPAPTAPPLEDTTPPPTVLVPATIPQQVSAASSGASPNFTEPANGSNPASPSPPTTRRTTTTTTPACQAMMTSQTVQPGEKDTAEISSDLHNAAVGVTAHFRSGDASYKAKTTGSGEAQVNINVPVNELPGQVDVDVVVGSTETCQTSFTIV